LSKVFYPGSFDPHHRGHLDIIHQASTMFDMVYIGIGCNIQKTNLFTIDERKQMLEFDLNGYNVEIVTYSGLLIDAARHLNLTTIIRGIRNHNDVDNEFYLNGVNKKIDPNINTTLLFASHEMEFISSTVVKDLFKHGANLDWCITPNVAQAIRQKYLLTLTS